MKKGYVLTVVSGLFLMFSNSAFAYLDPGTGSMILQIILGGLAGAAVAIRLYWYKILAMFGFKRKKPNDTEAS